MKREFLNLPFFLLLGYNALCYFRPPQISDAFIIISLAALYGLRIFLLSKEVKEIELDAEQQELQNQIDTLRMRREIAGLNTDITRIHKVIQGVENAKERKLVF